MGMSLEKVAERAERIYDSQLRQMLEANDRGRFVAIEPRSGDHFIGDSISEALGRAREAYPDQLAHVIRIGHDAAVHLGGIAK